MPLPQVKQGLKFNGLTDYVQLPVGNAVNPLTTRVEVNVTITPNDIVFGQVVIAAQNGINQRFYIGIQAGKWDIGIESSPWGTAGSLPTIDCVLGKKTSLKLIADSGTASLYVDGVLSLTKTYPFFTLATNLSLGTNFAVIPLLKGQIHYCDVTIGSQKSVYFLNEGTGTVATDTSGNGNNGTINGATWIIKKAPVKGKKNLFDSTKATLDQFINATGVMQASGLGHAASDFIPVLPSTAYTPSNVSTAVGGFSIGLSFYDVNKAFISYIDYSNGASATTFTTPAAATYIRFSFLKANISSVQLEKGSVATAFEPYIPVTDAKPMPQKPKKNMLPPFSQWTLNAAYSVKSDYQIQLVNPVASFTQAWLPNQLTPCKPNTVYTASVSCDNPNGRMYVQEHDAGGTFIQMGGGNSSASTFTRTFTTGSTTYYLQFALDNYTTTSGTFTFTNPQLELGSVATSFENYKLISDVKLVPLVPKKNMLPTDVSGWENGTINGLDGSLSGFSATRIRTINAFSVKPNTTYTISKSLGFGTNYRFYNGITFIATVDGYDANTTVVTSPSNATNMRLIVRKNDDSIISPDSILEAKVQIEEGSAATPFESYKLVPDVKHI